MEKLILVSLICLASVATRAQGSGTKGAWTGKLNVFGNELTLVFHFATVSGCRLLANDTVWLTLDQMAELFQRNKSTISRHFKNIFECGELRQDMVIAKNATTSPGAPRARGTQLPDALALPLQNIARYRRKKCIFAP